VVAEKVTRPRASGPFQFTGSESFSGVRVGGQIPDSDPNLGRVHPRANRETQMGQISQIAQRVSNANSRGIAQAAGLKGNGLGQPNASRGRSFLSNALARCHRPDRGYSLRHLPDLRDLRPGSIGEPPAWRMRGGVRVGTLTPDSDPRL
jgi:hypothetical protein